MRAIAAMTSALLPVTAMAQYTISAGDSPAPTYHTTLTFDEPGGPVGAGVPSNAWADSHGISALDAGDGFSYVHELHDQPGFGWLPDNNVFQGNFGVFITFEESLTAFSAQVWDNAGPNIPPFPGGGMIVALHNDGAEVAQTLIQTPAFGPSGDSWFDITASGGLVFDEVRFVGQINGGAMTIINDISFNTIPAPGTGVMIAGCGLLSARGRRP